MTGGRAFSAYRTDPGVRCRQVWTVRFLRNVLQTSENLARNLLFALLKHTRWERQKGVRADAAGEKQLEGYLA